MEEALDVLDRIKERLESDQKRIIKLQGKLEGKMEALKQKDLDSVEQAKTYVKRHKTKRKRLQSKFDKMVEDFQEDYPELMEES